TGCEAALRRVRDAALTSRNLMPPVIEAVEKSCTVGEISNGLRSVFGEHQETVVI
ncbi:MAG: methylmalonyl-CoA mutase, partial [Acidobacteria bacterium]|nr:methylmalonyl-CoA mutase [Acidobacteriota bacterium]